MSRSGKQKAIDKANRLLEMRSINNLNEAEELQMGTPIVTLKDKTKGKIVGLAYVVQFESGGQMLMKREDFYDNSPDDGLPF